MSVRAWPPMWWCASVDPSQTFICDKPKGHSGPHEGAEMPTVTIDEPAEKAS